MLTGKLLHGGDYNPEQWLEEPEILREDIRLMQEAHVNCVTLGVFSWAMLEPEEGKYDFGWLQDIIDNLWAAGIYVVLATPSGAMPHWLTQKYPEVMQVQENRIRNLPGRRHNFCYTSPVMRERTCRLDAELSRRFGSHPAVILWHISNELGGNWADSACHCELCQNEFRNWLKKRYGILEKLNGAWWNRFWSHVYTQWEQISSPAPNGECFSPALKLDWKRFVTERMSDFCAMEIETVKQYSGCPATTNFMEYFKGLDYQKLSKKLDLVSVDSYPAWHTEKDEVDVAVRTAASHHMMRSMKKQPFLLMESTPSCVNWRMVNPMKRPGMHMLSAMQAVACGADSVQYFQWRKGRGAYEKFHGAVIDHKNGSNTRTFREVTQVGSRLVSLAEIVCDTVNKPKAAIIFDWENWWVLEDITGPRLDMDYVRTILNHYKPFWEAGIDVDFIGMDDSLAGYTIVCAPENYMYRGDYPEKVREYVNNGGWFVTTYMSGLADETDLCFLRKHPLEDVIGAVTEEIDAPCEERGNMIRYDGKKYPAGRLCEVIHPYPDTDILAVYEDDYYKGQAAATGHTYGKGRCIYLAAEADGAFLKELYGNCLKETGVVNPFGIPLPYGVTVSVREGARRLVFVMNFGNIPVTLQGIGSWEDAESGECYEDTLELLGFECKLLTKTSHI